MKFIEFISSLFLNSEVKNKRFELYSNKKTYNFLVVSARQDELSAFTTLTSNLKRGEKFEQGAQEFIYVEGKISIRILTYTPNVMGMAYNSASVMRIICKFQPIYTLFIGTCAGLNSSKYNIGDVLVPDFIYNYESGKHKKDESFECDYIGFQTSDEIRKYADAVSRKISKKIKIITDDNFCSGSAIVDNAKKMQEIRDKIARKVSGLDMEAYSIACINQILREEKKHISVIKSIMDFGENKEESEINTNKKKAMENSAKVALEMIRYIHVEVINSDQSIKL